MAAYPRIYVWTVLLVQPLRQSTRGRKAANGRARHFQRNTIRLTGLT
jgi:hypothetical protein